jgi:ER-bound oxygenase mpaB/B'/Rubber oxygenase, catalytic domain
LTPEHKTEEQLYPLRYSCDSIADDALIRLQALQTEARKSVVTGDVKGQDNCPFSQPASTDLFTLLQTHHQEDPALGKLWNQVSTTPPWVDWEQIARGQDVFYRYGLATLTGLAFQSLLGGLGAGRIVETLARTGGFSTKVVRRRLFETTMHVLMMTRSLEDVQPGGEGWTSSVRVRLLHSGVRQRILKVEKENPGYFNVETLGIPASDLDSIATINSFSSSLLFQSLPRQGLFATEAEKADYLALWRYAAYLLGTPDETFASPAEAKRMMESLILYEINPTATSCVLASNMLSGMSDIPPTYSSRQMLAATARWLNGHDLCDALGIEDPSYYYYLLMVGQCAFSMVTAYLARYISAWETYRQEVLRRAFWRLIVENEHGLNGKQTKFEMKHVPRLGKMTQLEAASTDKDATILKKPQGIEARNLKTVAVGSLALAGFIWMAMKLLKFLTSVILR